MSIQSEKATVEKMIRLYCRLNHKQHDICAHCAQLVKYTHGKLDLCVFGEQKPACKKCNIHCYSSENREKVKEIMRFSGPRMLFYHPLDFLKHYKHVRD